MLLNFCVHMLQLDNKDDFLSVDLIVNKSVINSDGLAGSVVVTISSQK